MNTKEMLLGLSLEQKEIEVEGVKFVVKEMTAGQGTIYENTLYSLDAKGNLKINMKDARAKLIALTCCDTEGHRLFEDRDIEQIKNLPNRIAAKMFDEAAKMNKLNQDGQVVVDSKN